MSEGGQSEIAPVGECIRCRVTMVTGTLVQLHESSYERIAWRSDDGSLMQRLFRLNRLEIVALRCPRCGYLELFAPDGDGSSVGRGEG